MSEYRSKSKGYLGAKKSSGAKWDIRTKFMDNCAPYPVLTLIINVLKIFFFKSARALTRIL